MYEKKLKEIGFNLLNSAFLSSILVIYAYLADQDLEVLDASGDFKVFRAAVVIEMIEPILVSDNKNFLKIRLSVVSNKNRKQNI